MIYIRSKTSWNNLVGGDIQDFCQEDSIIVKMDTEWSLVAGRSRPKCRGRGYTGGHRGGRASVKPQARPPSKRQRVSTDSAGSAAGTDSSKPHLISLEQFKTLDVSDKLDKIFTCLHDIVSTNERLLRAEQVVYDTQNTAKVNTQRINLLAYKSIDSESRQRRNNLIFWGIPESLNEDSSVVLAEFLGEHLGLDSDAIFIQRAHRIGNPRQQRQRPGQPVKHRPLVACFRDYPDVELILSNAGKLKNTRFGINRDYPQEIINARKPLFEEKKTLKAQNPGAKISIHYPAKLVMNGRVMKDMFPQWYTVMRGGRLDTSGYVRSIDSSDRDCFETTTDESDMELDKTQGPSTSALSPSQQVNSLRAQELASQKLGTRVNTTEHVNLNSGGATSGEGEGKSNATNDRPPDSVV